MLKENIVFQSPCFLKEKKNERAGVVYITDVRLVFIDDNKLDVSKGAQAENKASEVCFFLSQYVAFRKHPKEPMVELKFRKEVGDTTIVLLFVEDSSGHTMKMVDTFTTAMTDAHALARAIKTENDEKTQATRNNGDKQRDVRHTSNRVLIHAKDKETRKHLLETDAEIKESYNHLVQNQYISEEEFWSLHDLDLAAVYFQSDSRNHSDKFLTKPLQLTTETVKKSGVQRSDINCILGEYPEVQTVYAQYVPIKMSEGDFWSCFFQSQFYLDMIGKGGNTTSMQILGDVSADRNKGVSTNLASIDPNVDLLSSDMSQSEQLVIKNQPSGRKMPEDILISRFNYHADTVLTENRQTHTEPFSQVDALHKRIKQTEPMPLVDLQEPLIDDSRQFHVTYGINVKKKKRVLHGTLMRQLPVQFATTDIETFTHTLDTWIPAVKERPSESDASKMFVANTKIVSSAIAANVRSFEEQLTTENRTLLSSVALRQTQLRELLRHFWKLTKGQAEKQKRIVQGLDTFLKEIEDDCNTRDLQQTGPISPSAQTPSVISRRALYQLCIDTIKTALEKA